MTFELARWGTRRVDGGERAEMSLPLRIAGYDVDVAGVVNNAVYVRWLEDLRTGFMARWLSFEAALARNLAPTLVASRSTTGWPCGWGTGSRGDSGSPASHGRAG